VTLKQLYINRPVSTAQAVILQQYTLKCTTHRESSATSPTIPDVAIRRLESSTGRCKVWRTNRSASAAEWSEVWPGTLNNVWHVRKVWWCRTTDS